MFGVTGFMATPFVFVLPTFDSAFFAWKGHGAAGNSAHAYWTAHAYWILGHHSGFAVPAAMPDPRKVVSDSIAAAPARKKPVPLPKLWEM